MGMPNDSMTARAGVWIGLIEAIADELVERSRKISPAGALISKANRLRDVASGLRELHIKLDANTRSYTSEDVLELAEAFEARAQRARLVYGGGKARCVTAETLEDCAAQVRRFAAMPAPHRTVALLAYLRTRPVEPETTALLLEAAAMKLPAMYADIARSGATVIRRFLDLTGASK